MLAKHPRGLPKDLEEGFGLLDDGGGAGWDLAAQLVSQEQALGLGFKGLFKCAMSSAAKVDAPYGALSIGVVLVRFIHCCLPAVLAACRPSTQVAYNPDDRPTASQALVHPYITNSPILPVSLSPAGTGTVSVMAQTGATAAAAAARSLSSTVGTVSKKVTEALPAGACVVCV